MFRLKKPKKKISIKKTEDLFNTTVNNFYNSRHYKNTIINNYNCIHHVFPFIYWSYSFVKIKFSNYFKKNKDLKNFELYLSEEGELDSYFDLFKNNFNIKKKIRFYIKYIYFINLIFFSYFTKRNKIWVFIDFKKDYRFNFLNHTKINYKDIFFFKFRFPSVYNKSKNINEAISSKLISISSSTVLWNWAIKILKPKKIIFLDNLYDDISLLLAAKKNKIQSIGVCHGPVFNCTKYLIGHKSLQNKKNLVFDRLYVWDEIFKKLLKNKSYLYNSSQIKICGWLEDTSVIKIKKKQKKKIILIAHEHYTDQEALNRLILFYARYGYRFVFKKRRDVKIYDYFPKKIKNKISFVDFFSKKDYETCEFALALQTTIIFDFLFRGIPVVSPNSRFNIYDDFKLKNRIFKFNKRLHFKIKNKKIDPLKKTSLNKFFLKEFEL